MGVIARELPPFRRRFRDPAEGITIIGSGSIGGKAEGLAEAAEVLGRGLDTGAFAPLEVRVPALAVIGTDVFDAFLERNRLTGLTGSGSDEDDRVIAHAFQRAELPVEVVGDLWALIRQVHQPLAVRSSSLLEDALRHPFAGVYATKMIPNNQPDADNRFRRLVEAVKLVYASTFSRRARDYARAAGSAIGDEKMAVVLQQVVGRRHGPRFYPDVSGVARSCNFYPVGQGRPEEGVASLALGLGKTIVDGGLSWTYSPAHPGVGPPVASAAELLERTQSEFWAVNMGPPPPYDPLAETEYLLRLGLAEAEADGVLGRLASTYVAASDRVVAGTSRPGPRVLDFAPLLVHEACPLNAAVRWLLAAFEDAAAAQVEIEFALTLPEPGEDAPPMLGFLQVRPMAVSRSPVEVSGEDMSPSRALIASERALGNGVWDDIEDVVFVKPAGFEARHTRTIAAEIEALNRALLEEGRPYVLVGFGRWGSSDAWLGIPVDWGQIAGARVIVEAMVSGMDVELSQGAHFFHNLLSFDVPYLPVPREGGRPIDWSALEALPVRQDLRFVRHARSATPLVVKVDGRSGRGVVLRGRGERAR